MVLTSTAWIRTMQGYSSSGTGYYRIYQLLLAMLCYRIFGTFEAERPDVGIVYGLVDQPQFWNPVKHQVTSVFHLRALVLTLIFVDILLWQGS